MIEMFFKFNELPIDFGGEELWSYLDYINLQGLIEIELPYGIGVDLIPLDKKNNIIDIGISLFKKFDNAEIINYAIPIDCIYDNLNIIKKVLLEDDIHLLGIADNWNTIKADRLMKLLTRR
jgi:hypothetical protein